MTTTNSVVANAIACRAVVRNAEIRVGDKIVCTKGAYKGVTATVKDLFVDEKGHAQIRIVDDKYGQSPSWSFGEFRKA